MSFISLDSINMSCVYNWNPNWPNGAVTIWAKSESGSDHYIGCLTQKAGSNHPVKLDVTKLPVGAHYHVVFLLSDKTEIPTDSVTGETFIFIQYRADISWNCIVKKDGWRRYIVKVDGSLPNGAIQIEFGGGEKFELPYTPASDMLYDFWFRPPGDADGRIVCGATSGIISKDPQMK